ncbi:hypothetical protein PT974_02188 [Cladobotryum mycophilum]|uniref:DUF7702 domain-containing protein n=1 Tax=Cladobotryum mycophilum TaxID=491253 RepID=A0ABR0SXI1_9HYPO
MTNSHTALGIAQLVFYVPIVPVVAYLLHRNAKIRPRMAWWPLITFSLMRLAGGPVIIALESNRGSLGLYIAAVILLNVGAIPLIIGTLGFIRIILMDNYSSNPRANKMASLIRAGTLVAICLLAAGGGVSSIGTESSQNLSRSLTLAGYIVLAAVLAILIGMALFFWRKRWTLLPSSQVILRGPLLASPFLIIRTIYGILEAALQNDVHSNFNPVLGNAVAFALMALLPEYITLLIYLYSGFSVAPDRGLGARGDGSTPLSEGADKSNV